MPRLDSRVAIVTGGGRGLGESISLTLAREGANVSVFDININEAERVAAKIKALGRNSKAYKVNIASSTQVNETIDEIIRENGKVDILVNNAGIISTHDTPMTVTDEIWEREMGVNLSGAFYCCRAVLPAMMKQSYGKIVNISSIAGDTGRPAASASYAASKAGIYGLTMSLAKFAAQYGINVNAVCPGVILTGIHDSYPKEVLDRLVSEIPFKRKGTPDDIANAVLFLASAESDFMTGTRLRVNGGSWMG